MATIRDQILGGVIAALSANSAGGKNPPTKPDNFTIHRERNRPIEGETSLPAALCYFEDDRPALISSKNRPPFVLREMTVAIDLRALGSVGVSPDQAIDPLLAWVVYQIFADESFGGLANEVEEGKTEWRSKEGDVPLAAATIHFVIRYRTSRIDPSSRT